MFGEKKHAKETSADPTYNYINNQPLSAKFFELLETRKSLPAYAAKAKIIESIQ